MDRIEASRYCMIGVVKKNCRDNKGKTTLNREAITVIHEKPRE